MSVLLVVDDEPAVIALFAHIFRDSGIEVLAANSVESALAQMHRGKPDAVMLDVILPDGNGMAAFKKMQEIDPHVPFVIMTTGGDSDSAIQAMQLGAMDYLIKPLDVSVLNRVVRRAIEVRRLVAEPVQLEPESTAYSSSAIIGRYAEMQKVYKAIGRVASQNISVLIRGESGTGKELVARAVFQFSERKHKPFLAVNCAAIPEALLESELFGHEKGSFTGADRKRIGKFEQCDGGTLFLDEIGDMDSQLQSKLLRVLQEKQFQRVGGNETLEADVRVVAATNKNLEQMCNEGLFREDLFYRLNGFTIQLPPLRARKEDIDALIEFFRHQVNEEMGKKISRVEPEAAQILKTYSWPGNIRELQSVMRQAIVQSSGSVLLADFLPDVVRRREPDSDMVSAEKTDSTMVEIDKNFQPGKLPSVKTEESVDQLIRRHCSISTPTLYDNVIEEIERRLIAAVLEETGGNQTEAAKRLGITRTTVRSKVNKLRIGIRQVVD